MTSLALLTIERSTLQQVEACTQQPEQVLTGCEASSPLELALAGLRDVGENSFPRRVSYLGENFKLKATCLEIPL